MIKDKRISVIGSGYMAEAIIKGLIKQDVLPAKNIFVVNPLDEEKVSEFHNLYGTVIGKKTALSETEIIIICFKPQDLVKALTMYKPFIKKEQLLISILAGVSTELLLKLVDCQLPIIRTMPNLALGVGEAATAFCRGRYANESHAQIVLNIFSTMGSIIEVEEKEIDTVTGLSGSGPAYFYYLLEAMISAGIKNGLSEENALELAKQTMIGAAKLLQESGEHPGELRKRITSAKGTTEAALKKMESLRLSQTVQEGVNAAIKRSQELGKAFEENILGTLNI